MSFFSKYRTVILVGILVIAAFAVYSYFFASAPQQSLTATAVTSNAAVDQDLITLLTTLKSIKLDASIFSDPAFQSLQDFSQALVPEPVGRTNPFAPLGSSPAGVLAPTAGTAGH
jgi:hypothetical protein